MKKLYVHVVVFSVLGLCCCRMVDVSTRVGTISGQTSTVLVNGSAREVWEFLGIPYAKPPTGELRFKKPEPMQIFKRPFNATSFGPICPQGGVRLVPLNTFVISEDCLFLNIFVPDVKRLNGSFPVMVYIHGGAFVTGTSNFYVADTLSAYGDVIVVTFNYRLTIFGFLSTEDPSVKGNFGLWDQHLALRWVHEHIASFNGDPNRVTVFGQSAGAISVIHQALYPGNKGLFQRIIAESGTAVNFGSLKSGPPLHEINYQTIGNLTNCWSLLAKDVVSCLKRISLEDMISALRITFYQDTFAPVIDGEFILADPQIMLDKTKSQYKHVREFFSSLDMIIGGNSMEGASYMVFLWKALLFVKDVEIFDFDIGLFKGRVVPNVLKQIYGKVPSDKAINAVMMRYTNILNPDDHESQRDMLLKLSTDYVFTVPNLKTATLHSDLGLSPRTYVYEFKTRSTLKIGRVSNPSWVTEAGHGEESIFVFGFSKRMLDALSVNKTYSPTAQEIGLSHNVMRLWTNFATTGIPTSPLPVDGCSEWPQFSSDQTKYLELSTNLTSSSVRTGYGEPGGSFWLQFMTDYLNPTPARTDVCQDKHVNNDLRTIIIILTSVVMVMLVSLFLVACWRSKRKTHSKYETVEM